MQLVHLPVPQDLRDVIAKQWQFLAVDGVPGQDSRIIAPNGSPKLMFLLQNGLGLTDGASSQFFPGGGAVVIGTWTRPVTLWSPPGPTMTIGVELTPAALHRLGPWSLHELSDRVVDLVDVFGEEGRALVDRLQTTIGGGPGVDHIHAFLRGRLAEGNGGNPLVMALAERIVAGRGLVRIDALEDWSGFSRRYIAQRFHQHLGISPKTLAAILRFQIAYRRWARDPASIDDPALLLPYSDQSHFIREFHRFTGYAPQRFARVGNEFGRIFHRKDLRLGTGASKST